MHKKQFYEAPDAELLVVRFEESFLTGTNPGSVPQVDPNDIEEEY